jgi:hypothetical protein
MKKQTVERQMFVRCRRQRDQFKRELRDLGVRFGIIRGRLGEVSSGFKFLRERYKHLFQIGSFVLMKDLRKAGKPSGG